jgi:hypothetical protein
VYLAWSKRARDSAFERSSHFRNDISAGKDKQKTKLCHQFNSIRDKFGRKRVNRTGLTVWSDAKQWIETYFSSSYRKRGT